MSSTSPSQIDRPALRARFVAGALAVLLARGVSAEDAGEPPIDAGLRDELLVTANRVEQRLDEAGDSVTVLTRADVERSAATTLDDLLRQVAGFSLFRRTSSLVAHPTSQGVSLRGISPSGVSRTLVLVDGVPANDPFGGWVYWSRIPLDAVERVEILRGGRSSLWGNYASGGVIHVTTRDLSDSDLTATALAGSWGDVGLHISGGRALGKSRWSLTGGRFETDGYELLRQDQRGAIDVPAFSEQLNLGAKVEVDLGRRRRLFVRASYFDEERGNGTPLTGNGTDAGQLAAGIDLPTERAGDFRLLVFSHDQTFDSTFSAQAGDRQSERPALDQLAVDARDLGGSLQWSRVIAGRQLVTAGTDARRIEGQTNESFFWDGEGFLRTRRAGGDQSYLGLFAQDLVTVSDRLRITLGGRVDLWQNVDGFRLETVRANGGVLRSERFGDRHGSAFSPRVGAMYAVTERVALRGAAYRSFRAPTVNELYRPFRVRNDITEANAGLDPETLAGIDIGLDYSSRRVFAALTASASRVRDPIANVTLADVASPGVVAPCGFVPAGGSCRQRQNLGETRILGFEAELDVRLGRRWRVDGSYLFSDGTITAAPGRPELEGKRIAQVPEHQITASLAYDHPEAFGLRLQGRYLGPQFEDDLNRRVLGSAVIADLSARVRLAKWVDLFVGLENLFDRTYEAGRTGDGLVTVGAPRRAHVGVRWKVARRSGAR